MFPASSFITDASKSSVIKSLSHLLNDYYYVDDINRLISRIHQCFIDIEQLVIDDENMKSLFGKVTKSYQNILNDINRLNENVCHYFDGNDIRLEETIFESINIVRLRFRFFIQMINEQLSSRFNSTLFSKTQEDRLHSFVALITTLSLIITPSLIIVPFIFLILISLNYFGFHCNDKGQRR